MLIKIKKLLPNAKIPEIQTSGSAGVDLHACIDKEIIIRPKETVKIPTGIAMAIPGGYGGFVFARSGLATKEGLAPANKVGVIDSDYRGEIIVALHNHSDEPAIISPGERIAQIVILSVHLPVFEEVEDLNETERGNNGFGSTGEWHIENHSYIYFNEVVICKNLLKKM